MGGSQVCLFASEGAAICVADLFPRRRRRSRGGCRRRGEALAVPFDVQRSDQWSDAVPAAEQELGPGSILCNSAGANLRITFDEQTEEMGNVIIGTILTGSFLGINTTVPSIRCAGGVIVNLGSIASIRRGGGSPAYGVGKMGLTRSAAARCARDNIRCVLVSQGHVDTPFLRANNPYSSNGQWNSIDKPRNYQQRL